MTDRSYSTPPAPSSIDSAATVDGVALANGVAASDDRVALLPLAFEGNRDEALDTAKELREELRVGERVDGVQAHLVGQSARGWRPAPA